MRGAAGRGCALRRPPTKDVSRGWWLGEGGEEEAARVSQETLHPVVGGRDGVESGSGGEGARMGKEV